MTDSNVRGGKHLSCQIPFIYKKWTGLDTIDTTFQKIIKI